MHHLANSSASAALNMATDQLMLEAYPMPSAARFRHYRWTEPAYTFGFAQPWGDELEALAEDFAVIRRETGGGLVDHQRDWTWSLVLPPGHSAAADGLTCLYSGLHRALFHALRKQEAPVKLQQSAPEPLPAGCFRQCFTRAERDDVILEDGTKVAGAAQRRTRAGVLAQGYVDRLFLPGLAWQQLEEDFAESLAEWLGSKRQAYVLPEWDPIALDGLRQRFASSRWNQYRKRNR